MQTSVERTKRRSPHLTGFFFCFAALSACNGGGDGSASGTIGSYYNWMNAEIQEAWKAGFFGQGTYIVVVDNFNNVAGDQLISGNLGPRKETKIHGEWTSQQIQMIAPQASVGKQDYYSGSAITLDSGKLNIVNLSYGIYADELITEIKWGAQESSIIQSASGAAVVVKAAGNDSVSIGDVSEPSKIDYLSLDLIGKSSAIFVGALDGNGTVESKASLAYYSNTAGTNKAVQDQFLVVGVSENVTGLAGTSFAAPIVSGYAAVLGSKFTTATPNQIANQLLNTARTDTISGYSVEIHGRGEASIAHALAPAAIE